MADLDWHTSSFTGALPTCVDVAVTPTEVLVRHSNGQGPTLHYTHPEWAAFLAGVRNNEFDLPEDPA